MKYRKKIVLLIFISLFASVLNGCVNNDIFYENKIDSEEKLNILTTIFPPYDFARQITGERANVKMLLPPGGESHSYEPSPRDIIAIQESDIFIFTGGESDTWIENILESVDTSSMTIIRMVDCVKPLEEEVSEGMVSHEGHKHETEYDEHVWTSPKNSIEITKAICEAAVNADVDNKSYYEEMTEKYVNVLEQVDGEFREIVKNGRRDTMVFGDRFPFRYFTEEYGLDYFAAFPGCSSESEPSVATMTFLIEKVKAEKIPVVFYLESSNGNIAKTLCETTGAKPLLFHSCHSLTIEETEKGLTYVDLMKRNAENLKEALQ